MRMLNADNSQSVRVLQLYLTASEAEELTKGLEKLLKDPEAKDHIHVFAEDMSRELSFSIVTPEKMKNIHGYTKLEQDILKEK